MNRSDNSHRIWLWLLIAATMALLSGKAFGIEWPLSPKVAFGRLLVHPVVAASEILLAAILLFLDWIDLKQKKWVVIPIAVATIGCAFYHLFFYFIGTELILIFGAMSLIRKYSSNA